MGPLATKFLIALAPSAVKAAGPLLEKAGDTLLDVFSHSAKTYVSAYGNLINAVADRIRGPQNVAATPPAPPAPPGTA
ncbi:MAG: hypothetical protein KKA05_02555 [Alphaproteobacteria bacterium]|nr:hypothetical protein [Alphaproteobacteria bacterium]